MLFACKSGSPALGVALGVLGGLVVTLLITLIVVSANKTAPVVINPAAPRLAVDFPARLICKGEPLSVRVQAGVLLATWADADPSYLRAVVESTLDREARAELEAFSVEQIEATKETALAGAIARRAARKLSSRGVSLERLTIHVDVPCPVGGRARPVPGPIPLA